MRARIYRIYVVPFALAKVVNERDGVYNVHTPSFKALLLRLKRQEKAIKF